MATNLLSALLAPYWACEGAETFLKEKGYPLHPTGLRNVVPAIRELVRLPPEEWAGALQREPGKGLGMIGAGAGEVWGTILIFLDILLWSLELGRRPWPKELEDRIKGTGQRFGLTEPMLTAVWNFLASWMSRISVVGECIQVTVDESQVRVPRPLTAADASQLVHKGPESFTFFLDALANQKAYCRGKEIPLVPGTFEYDLMVFLLLEERWMRRELVERVASLRFRAEQGLSYQGKKKGVSLEDLRESVDNRLNQLLYKLRTISECTKDLHSRGGFVSFAPATPACLLLRSNSPYLIL